MNCNFLAQQIHYSILDLNLKALIAFFRVLLRLLCNIVVLLCSVLRHVDSINTIYRKDNSPREESSYVVKSPREKKKVIN